MTARLLFLGASDDDFEVLRQRVRPGPDCEIKFANLNKLYPAGHEREGLPMAVDELQGYRADACIFSEGIGDPAEREAIFNAVLRSD